MPEYIKDKKYLVPIAGFIVLIIAVLLFQVLDQTTACVVKVNGKQVLVVKDQKEARIVVTRILEQEEKRLGHKVAIADKISYHPGVVCRREITPPDEIEAVLKKNLRLITEAARIMVNNKTVVWVASEAEARQVLNDLKNSYASTGENDKVEFVNFCERVEIKTGRVATTEIFNHEEALTLLKTGNKQPLYYEVKPGDSLWLIARRHNTHVADIKAANSLVSENLQIGQKLVISETRPYVNVVTVLKREKTEVIPYNTRVVYNAQSRTVREKQAGQNGEKKVVYRLTLRNGTPIEKKVLSETVIKKPVDQIIERGKRSRQPVMIASRGGSFIGGLVWPTFGSISQYFGRHGHTGIDIDADSGDPIRAARDGTVVYTGRSGGYGLMIVIDHGGGLQTRYAHCSKILVSEGQKVSRGQVIGKVGSTGHSTGSHLHFEVIRGGVFQNPTRYLN